MSLHACGRHKMQICQFANVAPMVSAPLSGAPEINYCFDLPKCQERVPRISSRGALGLHELINEMPELIIQRLTFRNVKNNALGCAPRGPGN